MARRSRKDSDSSVETVDFSRIRWREESTVLRTLPPETASNPWPCFELRDAVVLNKDGTALENALNVLLDGPFIVRGTMVIDEDDQREYLVGRFKNEIPIQINACSLYSIGEAPGEDAKGEPPSLQVLWVAGQGGWFEVNPAPAYQLMHRKIREAIKLYYTIYDIYDTFGAQTLKRQSKTSNTSDPIERLAPVFLQYAIRVGDGSTVEEVAARCNEIAPFLLCQFLKTDEEYNDWKKTYLYRWLTSNHKETYDKTWKALRSPLKNQAPPSTTGSSVNEAPPRSHKESSVNSDSTTRTSRKGTQTLRSTRTRSGSSVVTTEDAPTPEQAATTTIPIHSRATRSRSKSNNPISETTQKGTPSESVQNGKKILPAPSASTDGQNAFNSLLEVLQDAFDELSQKKKPPTKTQILNKIYFGNKFPNYRAGPGAHRVPVEEVFHFNAARLLQVLDKKKYSGSEIYTYIQQLAKTKFEPVALGPDKFPFLIVPRKSKPFYPRTATNQVIDTASALVDDDSEAHDDIPETPRMGKSTSFRRAGKSTLRPATSTKKRHHSDIESDSESPLAREAKKSHYFSDNDESNDKNVDESDEGESSFASVDPIRLVIRADKIPSTVPRGPDNAWTCDEEDCDYMVRGGDEEDCKARISEHFHAHEQQHNRVQLAMTEGTRGHLPVNHLLEKLKRLGEASIQEEPPTIDGTILPQPIRRNLIV
ncbi:unnamed protein product [Clonostachys rosea f. rosea IK726]|uniref:DNA (cytosine-5)-methyltransferase 1 replication foci domain-containing protein n=2 Tax=Bionectria ochroleuca TaxID=29856 RepID=A0A0B7KFS8_BIOOC|nr:unnamed protein product [Clonostachys rosea f. rosea IK726]